MENATFLAHSSPRPPSGKPSPDHFDKALFMGKQPSLMDDYEYVTCGRVYKVDAVPKQASRMWRAVPEPPHPFLILFSLAK